MKFCTITNKFIKGSSLNNLEGTNLISGEDIPIKAKEKTKLEEKFSKRACKYCGAFKVVLTQKQVRGLDESPSIVIKCYSCGKTKKYD